MSPRPRLKRRINFNPHVTYFKPQGIPLKELEEIALSHEEMEALRLKDYLTLDQNQAAEKMKISQPTFHRILVEARKKVAKALIDGNAIKIEE
jgi:predicted DNA-binding protein (UPF0251 family)